jgi:hypothetical protein
MARRGLSMLLGAAALALATAAPAESRDVTRSSRPVRLIRSWEETVKGADGRDVPRRVDVLYNYDKGVGYEEFSTLDGIPIGRMTLGLGHPSPSPEEIGEAFAVVRGDPEFARVFQRFHVVFEGGFLLAEGQGHVCGPNSRCLRVFLLSSDRAGTIRQVVVDLVKQRVVYDDFMPDSTRSPR